MGIILLVFKALLTHPYSTPGKTPPPTLNLTSKNNLTKMMLIVDIYISQEYDYFLKIKKNLIF